MNRFNESFHDTDPLTGRPFSFGHPDGVWVIGILHSLPVVVTAGIAVIAFFVGKNAAPIVPAAITAIAYIPPIVLLFRRSKAAVWWLTAIALIYLAGVIQAIVGHLEMQTVIGAIAALLVHAYVAFYAFSLKADSLLQ